MAHHRIHVAVLDTDVPCPSVYAKHGLYSSQFRVLLQAAAARINQDPDITLHNGPLTVHVTAFDAVGGSLPPLDCLRIKPHSQDESHASSLFSPVDAILITGSAVSAYDQHPWIADLQSFVQIVHGNYPRVKLFGSCFGHQLIAQALLSSATEESTARSTFHVEPAAAGFEMGIQPITLTPSFSAHFAPLARVSSKGPFRIQLIHGDQVVPTPEATAAATASGKSSVSLPAPWMKIGSSAQCPIQGLYSPGRVLTYQGHFEFNATDNVELTQAFGRRMNWPEPLVASYVEQIQRSIVPGQDDDDDSKAAAEAALLFFAGEDQPAAQAGTPSGLITPPIEELVAA
ncbi:hypothetical protein N7462_011607 [Penicillium macrosclerotiorum]|uniref:uncharacterized protein n=1 Tax=Penicillium macrosclerotiorum TaxID=303699 RepID=UPI0025475626|nr:uncharacterized protein N7462_011607 [Penicillium macrosclerotiorum]KAJ5662681.1 hypothetical protein N7462_011607 [Penicillium macrosclerotiorum]